eukprot:2231320-Pyramimonas_sp.AAC.1
MHYDANGRARTPVIRPRPGKQKSTVHMAVLSPLSHGRDPVQNIRYGAHGSVLIPVTPTNS